MRKKYTIWILMLSAILSLFLLTSCKKVSAVDGNLSVSGKTEYVLNEVFNKDDYTYLFNKIDNSQIELESQDIRVDGFDTSTIGQKTLIFSYEDNVRMFYIYVYDRVCTINYVDEEGHELLPSESIYSTQILNRPANPTKEADIDGTYSFIGWYNQDLVYDFSNEVTTDLTLVGKFSKVYASKSYVFEDYDGTIISQGTLNYGSTIILPADPDRGESASVIYEFSGWSGYTANMVITSDVRFVATYNSIPKVFTYTFYDSDETSVLASGSLEYGEEIPVPENPTKAQTAQYTYTFTDWDKTVPATITENISFTALYAEVWREYTYTFKNDGIIISSGSLEYGIDIPVPAEPTKTATAQYTYVFTGWDREVGKIYSDIEFNAVYDGITNQYTYRFMNGETVVRTITAYYGTVIVAPTTNPTKASTVEFDYQFTGWKEFTVGMTLESNIDFKAQYSSSLREYAIYFTDYNDVIIDVETVNIEYGKTVSKPETDPTRPSTDRYNYSFKGWYLGEDTYDFDTLITGSITLKATFEAQTRSYEITWLNEDNTPLATTQVPYGTIPVYTGLTPTKAATAQYTYTHSGWTPELYEVTGEATYKAIFSFTVNKYTVTWKNGIETIETDTNVEYGAMPSYDGETPTKEADIDSVYTFREWSPIVESVTGNVEYEAIYDTIPNNFTITWKNGETTIETDPNIKYGTTPEYNGETPIKASDAQYSYTFSGWNPTVSTVTGNAIYTATYTNTLRYYTVTWKNGETTIETDTNVSYGTMPIYNGETPVKEADAQYTYTFSGWTPIFSTVTGDITYNATYSNVVNTYTVTWLNEDGTLLTTTKFTYDTIPSYNGETPIKASNAQYTYTHNGWTPSISRVTSNVTYTATYTTSTNKYTVTWINGDTIIETDENVAYGTTPEYNGLTPTKASTNTTVYTFSNWSPAIEEVTENAVYTAIYANSERKYIVLWKNGDTTIETDSVSYNVTPVFNGTTPTKASDAQYTYAFSGWSPAIKEVTADVTYTATFTNTLRDYTVTWKNGETTIETDTNVLYGTTPEYNGLTPTKGANAQYTYTFNGWSPTISSVTGNVTYQAEFTSNIRSYVITWINNGVSSTQSFAYGTLPNYGSTPTKPSTNTTVYTFSNWSPTIVEVAGNETYTANYTTSTRTYSVTFKNAGTIFDDVQYVEYGCDATNPGNPTGSFGKEFDSWDAPYTNITKDTVLNAVFNYVEFTINYVTNDASSAYPVQDVNNPINFTVDDLTITLNNPIRYNVNTFLGWYTNSELTNNITSITLSYLESLGSTSLTLYASWANVAKNASGTLYQTIDDAIIGNSSSTITVLESCEFVDTGASRSMNLQTTLFLPYENGSTAEYTLGDSSNSIATYAFEKPTTYRYLLVTVPENLTINLSGTIKIASIISYQNQNGLQGHTSGKYSELCVNGTINVTGTLNTHGVVSGSGKIDAKSGAKIYSPFVVLSYSGGNITAGRKKGDVSPFNRYEMPNIQAELTINYGATYYGYCNLWASDAYHETTPKIIASSGALINLSSGAKAIKTFDRSNKTTAATYVYASAGHTTIRIIGGASAGSLSLSVVIKKVFSFTIDVDTADVLFPINCEYSIILENGNYTLGNQYKILPGGSLTVASDATLNVTGNLIIYPNFNDKMAGNHIYPSNKPAGELIVNGTLNVNSGAAFGGLITTTESNATININSNATLSVTSSEGTGALFSYTETSTRTCTAQAYINGAVTNLTKGKTYKSDGSNWIMQ